MQTAKKAFKVLVMGEPETGKSELCLHAIYEDDSQRPHTSPTVGMNLHLLSNNNLNHPVLLTIWDCAGFQIHIEAIKYRIMEASGFILVYDVGNRSSFENLKKWYALIKENAQQNWIGELIGNVKDSENKREVSIQEAVNFAKKFGLNFREMSTKDKKMVKSFFSSLFDKFVVKEEPKIMNLNTIMTKDPQATSGSKGTKGKGEGEIKEKKSDCSMF